MKQTFSTTNSDKTLSVRSEFTSLMFYGCKATLKRISTECFLHILLAKQDKSIVL